jgi:Na+/proline symporter
MRIVAVSAFAFGAVYLLVTTLITFFVIPLPGFVAALCALPVLFGGVVWSRSNQLLDIEIPAKKSDNSDRGDAESDPNKLPDPPT